jgi:hypothetical protein
VLRKVDERFQVHGDPVPDESRALESEGFAPPTAASTGRFFLQTNYGRRDIAQRVLPTSIVHHTTPEARARAGTERARLLLGLHPSKLYDA